MECLGYEFLSEICLFSKLNMLDLDCSSVWILVERSWL